MNVQGKPPVSASEMEKNLAYGWVVQIIHRDGRGVRHYGPFGDEDAANMWMVSNGPEQTLFTIIPIFDRIWD